MSLRPAIRRVLRRPAFSGAVVLTLALAVAAVATGFAVLDAVVLSPLPFADPGRLVRIYSHAPQQPEETFEASYVETREWGEAAREIEDLSGFATSAGGAVVKVGESYLRLPAASVLWNLPRMLGALPLRGRLFGEEDGVVGAEPVVLVGEDLVGDRLPGLDRIVGSTLEVAGVRHRVVGVLPRAFEYPTGAKLWQPIASSIPSQFLEAPTLRFINQVARLAPGATLRRAEVDLNRVADETTNRRIQATQRVAVRLQPLAVELLGDLRPQLWFLFAGAVVVLLVAAVNLAGLFTVRGIAHHHETVVRRALGAGWRHLLGAAAAEGTVLAVGGVALGLLLSLWSLRALRSLMPEGVFRWDLVGLDGRVLVLALLAAVLAVWGAAVTPTLLQRRTASVALGARSSAASAPTGGRALRAFVVGQIALAVLLLLGAGLLLRSFQKLRSVDPGFDREAVVTFALPLFGERYADVATANRLVRDLSQQLEQQGRITAAAGVLIRPLQSRYGYDYGFTVEGQSAGEQSQNPMLNYQAVTPSYFRALGVPLVAGRVFTDDDGADAPQVVIVGESVARRYFGEPGRAVGRRLKYGGPDIDSPWLEVVGVVGDVRYRGLTERSREIYAPWDQTQWPLGHVVVRSDLPTAALLPIVREQARRLDPTLDLLDVATTGELVSRSVARPRFQTALIGAFGLLALLLAAVGLYGVVSYLVAMRRQEIGVRMALGATPRAVLGATLLDTLLLSAAGIAVGLVAGLAATRLAARLIDPLLYGVPAHDVVAFLAVPTMLAMVALLAGIMPAWRASRVDPVVALRAE